MTIRAMGDDRPWEMIAREVIIRAIFRGDDRPRGDHQGHFPRATNDAWGYPTSFYLGRLHYGA